MTADFVSLSLRTVNTLGNVSPVQMSQFRYFYCLSRRSINIFPRNMNIFPRSITIHHGVSVSAPGAWFNLGKSETTRH